LGLLLEAERGSLELAKYNDLKAEVERLGIELSKIDKREALRDLEERMRSVEEEIDEIIRRSRGR